jgi:hypothetical protein
MTDPTVAAAYQPCQMCNDKLGMGAPPKPKEKVRCDTLLP